LRRQAGCQGDTFFYAVDGTIPARTQPFATIVTKVERRSRSRVTVNSWPPSARRMWAAREQFRRVRGTEQPASPFPGPIRIRDAMLDQPVEDLVLHIFWASCATGAE
jgi:hypothetical protein